MARDLEIHYTCELTADDLQAEGSSANQVVELVIDDALRRFEEREEKLTPEVMRKIEQSLALSIIDKKWREHLSDMDYLRAGIGLRAMGQRDPLTEYRREGYDLFSDLVASVKRDTARYLYRVEVAEARRQARPKVTVTSGGGGRRTKQAKSAKGGRNAPCPCGSGLKAKRCSKTSDCMAAARA